MRLKPGPNQKPRIHVENTRGMAFCGLGEVLARSGPQVAPRQAVYDGNRSTPPLQPDSDKPRLMAPDSR